MIMDEPSKVGASEELSKALQITRDNAIREIDKLKPIHPRFHIWHWTDFAWTTKEEREEMRYDDREGTGVFHRDCFEIPDYQYGYSNTGEPNCDMNKSTTGGLSVGNSH
jgi:hypothetical protein